MEVDVVVVVVVVVAWTSALVMVVVVRLECWPGQSSVAAHPFSAVVMDVGGWRPANDDLTNGLMGEVVNPPSPHHTAQPYA